MSAQALKTDNLPTPREETWKYTNLPRAIPENLTAEKDGQTVLIHKNPRKNSGEVCGKAEDICYSGKDGVLQTPSLKIDLEENSEALIIERHDGEGSYWKNMTTDINLAAGARLRHVRLVDDTAEAVNTNMVSLTMDRDSHYNGFTLNIGGKLTRHEIHAILNGSNAEVSFNGLNLLKDKQHGDTTILIEHAAPHCASNQFYRSILDDESRGVFQGKVHVHQIAQKTDGYQLSNALMLSDKAEMDTKPELEIYADDVKCSHGATTGQLDEEPLFYLRSRGLSEAEARFLMIQAFVGEVIEKIENEDLEEQVTEKVNQWLRSVLKKS